MPLDVKTSRRRLGFTLIEIMVVLAIIVVLASITVGVGVQVKFLAAKKYTMATMTTLREQMKDYLDAGNPEPGPMDGFTSSPASDPINWVKALSAFPKSANAINHLNSGVDGSNNKTILDGFGTPIRYVPSDPANGLLQGYFVSAGPDCEFQNQVSPAFPPKNDDLHSYDAP